MARDRRRSLIDHGGMMTDRSRYGKPREILSGIRFGKFVSVGAIGAVCDTTVLLVLTEGLGVLPEIATLIGIETAIIVMFLINEHWTFADERVHGREPFLGRLKRSHIVRAGGSLTQFIVFVVVYRVFFVPLVVGDIGILAAGFSIVGISSSGISGVDLWLVIAKATGIGVGMLVNYVAESLFTWRVGRS